MSRYTDVLQAVKAAVETLDLTSAEGPVPVVQRKLPSVEEQLDEVPSIVVCQPPGASEEFVPHSSRAFEARYPVLVALVTAADGNNAVPQELMGWRESVRDKFRLPGLAGAPTVYDQDVDLDPVIDTAALQKNYDFLGVGLLFRSLE